jgi:hypothetical protein
VEVKEKREEERGKKRRAGMARREERGAQKKAQVGGAS